MKVTAKELVTRLEGVLLEVMPVDYYGITFEMTRANAEYREEDKEVVFTAGNHNTDGLASIIISEDWIDSIELDEETNEYVISFTENMPNVVVSKFKSLEELMQERAERKQEYTWDGSAL